MKSGARGETPRGVQRRVALAALKRFAEGIREPDCHAAMREAMSSRELQEMLHGLRPD